MLFSWNKQSKKLEAREITKEDYDEWRYNYPVLYNSKHFAKVISNGDMLIKELAKTEKEEIKETKKKKK
jgi:hypothetical protein